MPNGLGGMEEAGIQAVIKGLGEFKAGAKEMEEAIGGIGNQADGTKAPISGLQQSFDQLYSTAEKAIVPLLAISGILVATTGKMVMTAARTEELGIIMGVVGKTAGYTEEQLAAYEEQLKAQNVTTQTARTMLIRFMQSELDLGDALKVAKVAQDLATIGAMDSAQAQDILTQAIVSQNTMVLRQFGLVATANQIFEQYASTLGVAADELDEGQKKQAILNYILEEGGKVAGAYDAAMESASKQIRSFPRYIEEISNEFGKYFLPYLAEGVRLAGDFAKGILDMSDKAKEGVSSVLMYATAMSVAVTAAASLVLILPKIAAAMSFLVSPVGLVAAALGFLAIKAIESQMALKKTEDELLKTAKTSAEYVRKMQEARYGTEKLGDTSQTAAADVREIRLEIDAAADSAKWYAEQSKLGAAETGAAWALYRKYLDDAGTVAQATAEAVTDQIKKMGQAFAGNIVSLQEGMAAYDELQNKVISVAANTAEAVYNYEKDTTRLQEDNALKREELLAKHTEKMDWVRSGDWQRSQAQQDEAHAYWEAINAQELAEFDEAIGLKEQRRTEDYNHQIAAAQQAAAERAAIEEEQRQAELARMREQQEERLTLLALEMIAAKETITVMSPWGELEVSAQEYYDAVKSGLVPVSADMREKLGSAIGFIDDSMTTANENIVAGYDAIGAIIQDTIPDVMELGTRTKEESEGIATKLDERLRFSLQGTNDDVVNLGTQFGVWAEDSNLATTKVGEGWDAMHEPIDNVVLKVGETEKFYGEEMGIMQTKTDETFAAITTAVQTSMDAVKTAIANALKEALAKLLEYVPKFREAGWKLVNGLIAGIGDKEEDARDATERLGRRMVNGLIAGIEARQGAACDAMERLVNRMIRAAEEAAGTHSPSRVFMGMGQDVVAGFIQGIQSMKPALSAEMQMTLAPVMQVAAPAMAGGGGGTTIYNYQYQIGPLTANYAQTQSPASILDDLTALQMLAGARG